MKIGTIIAFSQYFKSCYKLYVFTLFFRIRFALPFSQAMALRAGAMPERNFLNRRNDEVTPYFHLGYYLHRTCDGVDLPCRTVVDISRRSAVLTERPPPVHALTVKQVTKERFIAPRLNDALPIMRFPPRVDALPVPRASQWLASRSYAVLQCPTVP
jgi:hypothetical protein